MTSGAMAYFDFDNVKAEKAMAMQRYNHVRSVAKLFRLTEIFLVLVFLAWTSARVPFAVKISAEFFAKLGGIVASPLFVFLICNGIIATLLAKSGKLAAGNIGSRNADSELYEEIAKHSEDRQPLISEDAVLNSSGEEIDYQDKEVVSEVNAAMDLETERSPASDLDSGSDAELDILKSYRRCKSEKFVREIAENRGKELRRSETEKIGKLEKCGEEFRPQNELSNDEFNRRIEEFIAKQLQFRREESMSIVPQIQT